MKDKCVDPRAGTTGKLTAAAAAVTDPVDIRLTLILGIFCGRSGRRFILYSEHVCHKTQKSDVLGKYFWGWISPKDV